VPIAPGTKLGQYEVQDFIGQGAMGLVYRAYHSQLERTGAVKVLQAMSPDPDTTSRFRHEAQAIAQMRHPNIVNVYDFGDFQGTPYMIVEYVPGGSLAERMSKKDVDPSTALRYLRGIAAGLDYAHGHGVVHRDVKPANVLLSSEDTPVLADFGLAKLLQGSSLKSMTGVTTGTPAYMAPEQVTGGKIGPAADRYSLATIAYEMLTGVIPFDGEALMELLYSQVHREPPPPSSRNHSLGPRVDTVVMRGLAKDPGARWESCTAFVEALAAALAPRAEPAVDRTVVMAPRASAAAAIAAPGRSALELGAAEPMTLAYPSPPQPQKKKSRRGLWAVAALAVAVVLLVAATIGYLVTRPSPTISLSQDIVQAGDTLVVSASNLPARQGGVIQLLSVLHEVPFQADSKGEVVAYLTVPPDTFPGTHTVQICWSSACHASTRLEVLARAVPTAAPATSPSPTPARAAGLAASPSTALAGVTVETVSGFNFTALQGVSIELFDPTTSSIALQTASTVVRSDGSFEATIKVPVRAAHGKARIAACDAKRTCAYTVINVS
jgi:serine/threonine-protein kinase